MDEKTLICPKCAAYSLEVDQVVNDDDITICQYECFNCGFHATDEEYQGAIYNAQRRIDALDTDETIEDDIHDLNFLLLREELKGARI